MSFGAGFGAFAGGLAGGLSTGQTIKGGREKLKTSQAAPDTNGAPTGFGLGKDLVSGDIDSAKIAEPEAKTEGGGLWGTLSGIVGSLGGGTAAGALAENTPVLKAAPSMLKNSIAGKLGAGGILGAGLGIFK